MQVECVEVVRGASGVCPDDVLRESRGHRAMQVKYGVSAGSFKVTFSYPIVTQGEGGCPKNPQLSKSPNALKCVFKRCWIYI